MLVPNLPLNPDLSVRSRLAGASLPRIQSWELAWLGAMGVAAALAANWGWSLRIPGHAIVRIVFPMTLGLAVVPRRGSGMVMGASAMATSAVLSVSMHITPGIGALTSLAATGPLLDVVLWRAGRGWLLYGGFALAGLGSNLAALAVRGVGRLGGMGRGGGGQWWLRAPLTYAACGLLAGLICGAIWFASKAPSKSSTENVRS